MWEQIQANRRKTGALVVGMAALLFALGYVIAEASVPGAGFFGLAIAAYFFLMNQERSWPPPPFLPPDLLFGTIFTVIILLSEIPNTLAKRYAEALELRGVVRDQLLERFERQAR